LQIRHYYGLEHTGNTDVPEIRSLKTQNFKRSTFGPAFSATNLALIYELKLKIAMIPFEM